MSYEKPGEGILLKNITSTRSGVRGFDSSYGKTRPVSPSGTTASTERASLNSARPVRTRRRRAIRSARDDHTRQYDQFAASPSRFVPLLRRAAPGHVRRPRPAAPVRVVRRPRGRRADGAVLPAPRADLRACLLVQLPEYVDREEIFREYAYFSSYSDSWVEHARQYADAMIAAPGPGRDQPRWSSWRATTATSSSTSSPAASRRSGIEPAANVAAAAEARGVPTLTEFFGRDLAERLVARAGTRPTWSSPTTCWPRCPDLNDFVAGIADPARPGRRRDARVPPPRPARRGRPVRHDLPRALLVLLADDGRA